MACKQGKTIIDACQSLKRRAPIVRGTITRVDEKKGQRDRKRGKKKGTEN